ncbi:MAG: Nucleotide-binding universal stress protein, UspA family [Chloroflexi bacterium]|nr:MAG: Nucleotide-binding universal stress protein, UspA family [Chloroflexota bacterium]
MYSRILVPLDGSKLAERILPYATLLNRTFGTRIDLLRAVTPPSVADSSYAEIAILPSRASASDLVEYAAKYMKGVEDNLRSSGIEATSTTQLGNPADVIAEHAAKEPNTLVAMSTHGRTGMTRWVMGSVTDRVIQMVDQPMLVVRPNLDEPGPEEFKFETIIVPLDGSSEAEQGMEQTLPLAKALGLRVVLVTANPDPKDYYMVEDYPAGGVFYDFTKDVEQADTMTQTYLERIAVRLRGEGFDTVEIRLSHGDAGGAIVDIAKETPNSLIGMATHGRSGVGRWVMGSVSSRVIRHSGDPVLLTRTKG